MPVPEFVPVKLDEVPPPPERLPAPPGWRAERPADLAGGQPIGAKLGRPGPDQGYGLVLARRFEDKLVLQPGEHREDAVAGCLGVGLKRASMFGRAPVVYDFGLAFTLWGFLGGAPDDLLEFRKPLFAEARHHYWGQREICDLVPEETLRLAPADLRDRLADWRSLFTL
jgi:hypothetical protein